MSRRDRAVGVTHGTGRDAFANGRRGFARAIVLGWPGDLLGRSRRLSGPVVGGRNVETGWRGPVWQTWSGIAG